MENITLGSISNIIVFIVAFIGGVEFIVLRLNKLFDKKIEPLKQEIKNNRVDNLKTDLVNYQQLARLDKISETQKLDYYEKFDEYTKMGLNSYVHQGHDELVKEGKL